MANDYYDQGMDWNDEIEQESNFIELPEGDYDFTIDHYERGRSKGEGKLPPCNMAIVYFNVHTLDGRETQIRENFVLHKTLEWKLSQLFRSVGLKKEGEKISMRWDDLAGLSGRCHLILQPDSKDPEKKYNHIKELYPKEPKQFTAGSF